MAQPADPLKHVRRFYTSAAGLPHENGHALGLDGRIARTPGGAQLVLPTARLADLLASEWNAQGEHILYGAMPATRLAHTAIDIVPGARPQSVEGVVRFAAADLLCYFAESPGSLVRRQEKVWGPLLDWARDSLGLTFERAAGIVHRPQPPETLARLTARLEPLDDFTLAGLAFSAALFGSAVLALSLWSGRIKAEVAMGAARLDEIFQEEQWGVDAESEVRADAMAVEAVMAERWFAALRPAA